MEPYDSFAALQANATVGVDYRIRVRQGRSVIAVMSIHGGGIEPGTTEIAETGGDQPAASNFLIKARTTTSATSSGLVK